MTITIETINTPDGFRYIGIATPANHPHIQEVGTGWCLTPVQAFWAAVWHYRLAAGVYEMQARKEARAA